MFNEVNNEELLRSKKSDDSDEMVKREAMIFDEKLYLLVNHTEKKLSFKKTE